MACREAALVRVRLARHYVVVSVGPKKGRPMPSLIPDFATFERRLARLPVVKHRAREVILTAGSKTGELLFLRSGAVEVIKDGVQIASVSAPGSVFGELAVLLDQPHTADVGTLEQSEFYVANAQAMLAGNPTVALYVRHVRLLPKADTGALKICIRASKSRRTRVLRAVDRNKRHINFSCSARAAYLD
jgi:CRP-like cAMP-binding protein